MNIIDIATLEWFYNKLSQVNTQIINDIFRFLMAD